VTVLLAAIGVLVIGGVLLARRTDIRLVLMGAAAVLFAVHAQQSRAGNRADILAQFFLEFVKGMTNPQFVVPICTAMGFAYVCKFTGCDAHLVHLLVAPLRRVRLLLIPGGIAVAFFVNSAIVSQTSTVSVVGPVLVPLILAAGYSRKTAGALLLLGGSMGGELLNPAAVEVTAIKSVTGLQATEVIRHLLPFNLLASGVALLAFWALAIRYERAHASMGSACTGNGGEKSSADDGITEETVAEVPGSIAAAMGRSSAAARLERVNVLKALVPLVPIFLLVVVRRMIPLPPALTPSEDNKIAEQAVIAAAMLLGVACAAVASPNDIGRLPAAFFEGAGFVYAHVISIIAAAIMFAKAVEANGLIELMTTHLKDAPAAVSVASVVVPWVFACVTGTAVGTAPLVINIILPIAMGAAGKAGGTLSPAAVATGVRIGSLNAIAAQFGRTSSPVAPVTVMCATLARVRPVDLVARVLPPLILGGIALLIAALWVGR
jgi:DcuC family C4-dicarboxylate transporter